MSYDPGARAKADLAANTANQALALASEAQQSVALLAWTMVNSNLAAADGQRLSVDTTVQPVTITLPLSGSSVVLRDNADSWGTHPVTIVGNGALIDGQATFLLNMPGFEVTFILVNGAWRYTLQFLNGAAA